ncbi:hypothetical protein BDC45DRAFT_574891 [Circinella umbellata]|nr:hypothetical protein BDC45DRAFT_574891 [Circinella umbellata]
MSTVVAAAIAARSTTATANTNIAKISKMLYVGFGVDVEVAVVNDLDVVVAGDGTADQVYLTVFVIEFPFLLLIGFDSYRFRPFSVPRVHQV